MEYNLDLILKRMEEFKDQEMSLHGGEPLCLPKKDVEKILAKMYELQGRSGIQTNGTLIDEDFIGMFKKYKTHVGISFDGPGELSEFRGWGNTEAAKRARNLDKTIERLVKEGIQVGLIIVISKSNAGTNERLKKLKDYLLKLKDLGITEGRLNPCQNAPEYELSIERLKEVYLDLAIFCLKHNLKYSPFIDIVHGLQGKSRVCVFSGCDIFSTPSATTILGDGSVTNCMRTNKEYVLLRHPAKYDTRTEILAETPQEFGGCKDCKYFTACYGGCPESGLNGDWRNRTYFCPVWKELFKFFENVLKFVEWPNILPQSCQPCQQGPGIAGGHGDHYDFLGREHGDFHGDSHGDSHGDHEDSGIKK